MEDLWASILPGFGGFACLSLWTASGIGLRGLPADEQKTQFKEMLIYGFKQRRIVEYDDDLQAPIFSEDNPEIVVDRILNDWPRPSEQYVDGENLIHDPDFMYYMIMLGSFAELIEGTTVRPLV